MSMPPALAEQPTILWNCKDEESDKFKELRKDWRNAEGHQTRLILLDYDGTLTPICGKPEDALPSLLLLRALKTLTGNPRNIVYVISGRDEVFLQKVVGRFLPNVGLSAEHGVLLCLAPDFDKSTKNLKGPNHSKEWIDLIAKAMPWKRDVAILFKELESDAIGSGVEEKRMSVTLHTRGCPYPFLPIAMRALKTIEQEFNEGRKDSHATDAKMDIMVGKKNIEVRPGENVTKGSIVELLLFLHPTVTTCVCAGDDTTDQDMFKAVRAAKSANEERTAQVPHVLGTGITPALRQAGFFSKERINTLQKASRADIKTWNIAVEQDKKKGDKLKFTAKDADARLLSPHDMVKLLCDLSEIKYDSSMLKKFTESALAKLSPDEI